VLGRDLRLDQRIVAVGLLRVFRPQFQSGDRPHHDGALQFGHDAHGTGGVTFHFQIVRAHVGIGPGVARLGVFGAVDGHALQVQLPFMRPAVKQIHVAQEAVNKRAGRVFPHLLRGADLLNMALVHEHHPVSHL